MSGTKINDLMEMNGQPDDDRMVDSIINELNNEQPSSQQQMPQLTPEEKEMLMQQQTMIDPAAQAAEVAGIDPNQLAAMQQQGTQPLMGGKRTKRTKKTKRTRKN